MPRMHFGIITMINCKPLFLVHISTWNDEYLILKPAQQGRNTGNVEIPNTVQKKIFLFKYKSMFSFVQCHIALCQTRIKMKIQCINIVHSFYHSMSICRGGAERPWLSTGQIAPWLSQQGFSTCPAMHTAGRHPC